VQPTLRYGGSRAAATNSASTEDVLSVGGDPMENLEDVCSSHVVAFNATRCQSRFAEREINRQIQRKARQITCPPTEADRQRPKKNPGRRPRRPRDGLTLLAADSCPMARIARACAARTCGFRCIARAATGAANTINAARFGRPQEGCCVDNRKNRKRDPQGDQFTDGTHDCPFTNQRSEGKHSRTDPARGGPRMEFS
jgi:hypothetical protein